MSGTSARAILEECYAAAVESVNPRRALSDILAVEAPPRGEVCVIAAGKAAVGMATALVEWVEASDARLVSGVVVGAGPGTSPHRALRYIEGDHPLPGDASRRAAEAIHHLIGGLSPRVAVHVAMSGGASSLIAGPLPGLAMEDVTAVFDLLHRAGVTIDEMNAVRKRVTRWSAGRLAIACHPNPLTSWVISDVPGDDLGVIASGPCHGDRWTTAEVRALLAARRLDQLMPTRVAAALARETPKPHQVPPSRATLVASNAMACAGAARAAARLGLVQRVAAEQLTGDAAAMGRAIATEAIRAAREWHAQNARLDDEGFGDRIRPLLLVWGGETTVALERGSGIGGRCQELALAAASMLEVSPHPITLLAAGTDGRDGPTDAAGAIVDHATWQAIATAGFDPAAALGLHDAYPALDAVGALLRSGYSGTNVMDVVLALVELARPRDVSDRAP